MKHGTAGQVVRFQTLWWLGLLVPAICQLLTMSNNTRSWGQKIQNSWIQSISQHGPGSEWHTDAVNWRYFYCSTSTIGRFETLKTETLNHCLQRWIMKCDDGRNIISLQHIHVLMLVYVVQRRHWSRSSAWSASSLLITNLTDWIQHCEHISYQLHHLHQHSKNGWMIDSRLDPTHSLEKMNKNNDQRRCITMDYYVRLNIIEKIRTMIWSKYSQVFIRNQKSWLKFPSLELYEVIFYAKLRIILSVFRYSFTGLAHTGAILVRITQSESTLPNSISATIQYNQFEHWRQLY